MSLAKHTSFCGAFPKKSQGMTLIELQCAMVVFAVAVIGGSSFFVHARRQVVHQERRREAKELAVQTIETLKSLGYGNIAVGTTAETSTLSTGTFDKSIQTTESASLKTVTVTISFAQNSRQVQYSLTTQVSPR